MVQLLVCWQSDIGLHQTAVLSTCGNMECGSMWDSLLVNSFKSSQESALEDYIEDSVMLQYNSH